MKHFIPYFVQEQLEAQQEEGCLSAYTLFIDLSGFTPLTEVLMRKGHTGAERLSTILNEIFEPLVQLMYARGGFIPYFAGDAFTAIFPTEGSKQDAETFIQTAAMARELFQRRENQFDGFTIGLKFGLSYGQVEWGIVGNDIKSFYFKGQPIDSCAYCQTLANDQDIIIDGSLLSLLTDNQLSLEPIDEDAYKVTSEIAFPAFPPPTIGKELSREVALQFLPESVVNYKQEGEFRPVVSIFISFSGINSHEDINTLAGIVLEQTAVFSGYFKEIDFGDKGGVVTIFFGAPVAFENNVSRALEFILSLSDELQDFLKEDWKFRTGITVGTAYTGIVGGHERCQYACVGNRVNLAARLMSSADWGDILVDEEIQNASAFKFFHTGNIKYKGIKKPIPTYKLQGRNFDLVPQYASPLIAREEELSQLTFFAQPLFINQNAGIAYVFGEAGIGKSRLAFELQKILLESGRIQWQLCRVDQILRKPFNPFIYFLRNYFEQSPERAKDINHASFERRFQQLEAALKKQNTEASINAYEELERTKAILSALLGIHSENSLWKLLDAKGRYLNSISSIINLFLAESLIRPLIIEIEDSHWLDDSSKELLLELTRQMPHYPIQIFINSRYADDGSKPYPILPITAEKLDLNFLEVDLNTLSSASVKVFAETSIGGEISEEFLALLLRATNNNPFYVEQMLEYFSESNLLEKKDGLWTIEDEQIQISNSINAILTARIDRLSENVRETVKAAAVIGREFDLPVLTKVMLSQEHFSIGNKKGLALLKEEVKSAEQVQIWRAMNELRYIFRHSLLREAVYSMQLQTRLKQLHHLIAEAIEHLYANELEDRYVDLAFHYEQAGVETKTGEYLRKAADHARQNYQNHLALEYYEKLLKHLGKDANSTTEIKTYLKKGKLLEVIGNWTDSEKAFKKALQLSKQARDIVMLGESNNLLGHLLMMRGSYSDALKYLKTAVNLFESIEDHIGFAKVHGNLGNLHLRQGEYKDAKGCFEQSMNSGYVSGNNTGGAQVIANLALTQMNLGDLNAGIQVIQKQLPAYRQSNNKQGLAILMVNLGIVQFSKGDYSDAQKSYEEGLELAQELGDKQLVSIAMGSLGLVIQKQGHFGQAMDLFQKDLQITEELGDKQGIAIALGLIGDLLKTQGEFYKSVDYLQKNLMLCEELGYQKGIAKTVNILGDIFYFREEYERSLHYYERAIGITRNISHKIVLCASLIEKGLVLIKLKRLKELLLVEKEAFDLAYELDNKELLFDAQTLKIRALHLNGQTSKALLLVDQLQKEALTKEQQAEAYYLHYKLLPIKKSVRLKAINLFEELFDSIPKYEYKSRLEQLEAPKK